MHLIRIAIERPIAVMSMVLMVIILGLVALQTIPIQLTPDVRKPVVQVTTTWAGAAPAEVEREITDRQEDELNGLEGLEEISSASENGRARVTLEYAVGTDMNRALLLVANRLDRVNGYPEEADEPTIKTSGTDDNPITWMILQRKPGNDAPMHSFLDFAQDVIQDRLERVKGVAGVNVFGGGEREMQVIVHPEKMARYGLTVTDVVSVVRTANASVSAGDVDEGKRQYVVRMEGDLESLEQTRAVVLRSTRDAETGRIARVTVGDIADVAYGYKTPRHTIRLLAQESIAVNAVRETGANVIETMAGIRAAIAELNRYQLPNAGLHLRMVYDETTYINSAIHLVQQNIYVGGTLAALILLLFLRSAGATLAVSLAIPVSVIGSFVAMTALGRSINVISLAGIAFAVGMVVDAAIVVIENIYRHRQEGLSRREAAYRGASQVWGAILVSALTTVMVFIPVLIMQLEVGQLFRDIAVAISVAVLLSLVVSITVIPALAKKLLGKPRAESKTNIRVPVIDPLARGFVKLVLAFTRRVVGNRALAVLVVAVICGVTGVGTYLYLPKLDYLPDGNRNLVFGVIQPPPGYNLSTTTEIAKRMEGEIRHLWASVSGPDPEPGQPPKIQRFFFVARADRTFIGAASMQPERVKELIPVLREPAFREPGTFGFVSLRSLFGRGISGSRSIDLNISGPDLEQTLDVAIRAVGMVGAILPESEGTQIRPRPGLELGSPEVRIIPDRVRLADNGVSARELGDTIDTFNDGLRVAEISVGGKRLDLTIIGTERNVTKTQGINNLPVVTRDGMILPVSSLADVIVTSGPTEIRHLERDRTVTLDIRPPDHIPLEAAIENLQTEVIDKLEAQGLPAGTKLYLTGTADKLAETWRHMSWDLLLAVVIVYLVMAVLFESFIYPSIIMLSVPLATAGGVAGLAILNLFVRQPLDMLTLLGFVILIGIVVNNAILLVHQTLYHLRCDGMSIADAIVEATGNRIRPIFMSTLTSVFGMMPLVAFPGAGSELYRGLGSVVLGGLSLSAVLTLAIIPPLLSLVAGGVEGRRHDRESRPTEPPELKAAAE
jgi:HAE1 family hydrophobic/amphiphilic exporter-1